MAVKLAWTGAYLYRSDRENASFADAVGEVRSRCEGIEWDYVTRVRQGEPEVSEPYKSRADAYRDCEIEVRRLLKAAGVEVE